MRGILNKKLLINKKRVLSKEINKEVVFLDKQQRVLYELNKTASFIWARADGKHTIKEIIQEMSLIYNVDREKAEKDIIEFVQNGADKKVFILL